MLVKGLPAWTSPSNFSQMYKSGDARFGDLGGQKFGEMTRSPNTQQTALIVACAV